jgi:hypothetical protein
MQPGPNNFSVLKSHNVQFVRLGAVAEDVDGVAFDADDFARRVLQLAEARKREDA